MTPRRFVCAALATLAVVAGGCASVGQPPPAPALDADRADRQILVTVRRTTRPPALRGVDSARRYPGADGYGRRAPLAATLARDYGMLHVVGWPIDVLDVDCIVFELSDRAAARRAIQRLAADERVESVQPMGWFHTMGRTYDDPLHPLQTAFDTLNLRRAHAVTTGAGVSVAIVDTAIDTTHPDFAASAIETASFVNRPDRTAAAQRHGTAVAGIIGARAGNGVGIVGVAPDASLLTLAACWHRNDPALGAVCNSYTLARAIAHAIDRRAGVINLSLTGPRDPLLGRLIARAMQSGAIVVSADPGYPDAFPASLPGVVGVRAATSREPVDDRRLAAPGDEILTLEPGGGYGYRSGSSMAAAHVSGIAALVLSRRSATGATQLADALRDSFAKTGGTRIDVCAALNRISGTYDCGPDTVAVSGPPAHGKRAVIPTTSRAPATSSP